MPPAPLPRPPADPGHSRVRLDVRLGPTPARSMPLAVGQFLIGGADGCDLSLTDAGLPAVACVLTTSADGTTVRRHDRGYPVSVNGRVLPDLAPVRLSPGDRVIVGPAELTLATETAAGLLRPRFIPVLDHPPPRPTRSDAAPSEADALRQRVQALEAEREQWVRQRAELEAECQRLAERGPRALELAQQHADLATARDELDALQRTLSDQYRDRREQLVQMQEAVHKAATALREREQRFEADVARRAAELADRERALEALPTGPDPDLVRREQEVLVNEVQLTQRKQELADGFLRLDRQQAALADRQREVERQAAEADERVEQLRRASLELEEQVRLAEADQGRLAAESARLTRLKADLESQANRQSERSAQLDAQQAMLAVLRSRLDRHDEELKQDATQVAADRTRLDDSQRELDARLRGAERVRAELDSARVDYAERERVIAERTALLDATLAEIQQQKQAAAADQARLQQKEQELDERSADLAEQTAVFRARAIQVQELQARLEADRTVVREREASVSDADAARQTFQEQLRRRADDLAARSKQLDEENRRLADTKAELDRLRDDVLADRDQTSGELAATRAELAGQSEALSRRSAELSEREVALERQVARLREAGRATAAARKELAEGRRQWESDRSASAALVDEANARLAAMKGELPQLDEQARAVMDRLASVREVLHGQLKELHRYAGQSRSGLDAARAELRAEADRVRDREQQLEQARDEHRLAVAGFRQQLIDWQARVAELKQALANGESRLEARHDEVAREAEAATVELARQAEELRHERQQVAERRAEVEQHLADMREWYRKKLRELASSNAERGTRNAEPEAIADSALRIPPSEELDPGDRRLGDLLRSMGLVESDTLADLWADARRQRRTLRQVLLASGAVTLYQLALIEAGNLDHLVLGRFRVLDRVRASGHEAVYRVFDPSRPESSVGGLVLRHLAEAEMDDAVRPDEFRQRFATAREAAHRNLQSTFEVLEVNGRPAVLQEWMVGLPAGDWPDYAAVPGVWLRLVAEVAAGLAAAHTAGLPHGRLTSDAVVLTPDGTVKLAGVGDPPWLAVGPVPEDPTPATDLRALGQLAYTWSQLGQPVGPRRRRGKGLPDSLAAVIRRLEADPETPMGDTVAGAVPYRSAAELVADLTRLATLFPTPPDAWERLVGAAAEAHPGSSPVLRRTA